LSWALDQNKKGLIEALIHGHEFPDLQSQILRYKLDELERIEALEKKDLKAEKIKNYEQLLSVTLHGEHWSSQLEGFCELDAKSCKPYLAKIPERLAFLEQRSGPLESERESMIGDEYFYITETFHALGEKQPLNEYARKCADHFLNMQKNSALKISRAGNQGVVACLELAGDFSREEKTLEVLLKTYPNEPTFVWRKARMLRAQKKLDESLIWIKKAEGLAYGYNWFSIQVLKTQILLTQKKNDQAMRVVQEALAKIDLDSSTEGRNQRLVARLRGLESSAREAQRN
jgi:hypothetical protein